ncbi:MAG: dehydrogenase, partial [Methanosarcinales archaeon]|nr:dehydrogenase [Methanosarcinales archaeon]
GNETVYLLQFSTIFENIHHIPSGQLTIITLLFFGGAVGKSGQFPLHVWLPDAMEGPTTVSALIHAATMVTAGVYLVARTFPMFIASPGVELAGITIPATLTVVAYIGGFTALFASTMGLVMNDIKRVLAFSTISQLGYMMLALGMGSVIGVAAVGFAMFHLINHAFFKACLFLCAGSVIHSTGTNDLREMGGLMSKMKITGITMLFSSLALAGIGIPFLKIAGTPIGTSGFVSKDAIIVEGSYIFAHMTNDWIPFAFGILAALLTAIYTFRLWFMAFTGKPRQERHPHESPATMTGVLSILAVFALVFGMLTFIPFTNFVGHTYDHHEIEHLAGLSGNDGVIDHDKLHHIITEETSPIIFLLPVIVGVGGLLLAWMIYNRRWISVASIGNMQNPLFAILAKRYYQHEIFIELISLKFTYGVLALT